MTLNHLILVRIQVRQLLEIPAKVTKKETGSLAGSVYCDRTAVGCARVLVMISDPDLEIEWLAEPVGGLVLRIERSRGEHEYEAKTPR